ncbi:MAG: M28 family peptidase [Methanobacteriota archaeon]
MPKLSSENVWTCLNDICRIGPRWPGTREEIECRDYIHDRFLSYGLKNVRNQEFEYLSYTPVAAELKVTSPIKFSLPCAPAEYSANIVVEGEVVYTGTCTEPEIEVLRKLGVDFDGKIVLCDLSVLPIFTAAPIIEELGAKGYIFITPAPDNLISKGTVKLWPPPEDPKEHVSKIPGVIINGPRDAERIRTLLCLGKKVTVQVKHEGTYQVKKSWNVLGDVVGVERPEQIVMVCGGHYDTQINTVGAWDNASGVSGMLELARAFGHLHPRRTIRFMATSCEEIALWGSWWYVREMKEGLKDQVVFIVMDGLSGSLQWVQNLLATPKIMDFALECAREVDWRVDTATDPHGLWFFDSAAFIDDRIPYPRVETVSAHEGPLSPFYHTEGDKPDKVDPEKLVRTLRVNGLVAFKLAYLTTLPY